MSNEGLMSIHLEIRVSPELTFAFLHPGPRCRVGRNPDAELTLTGRAVEEKTRSQRTLRYSSVPSGVGGRPPGDAPAWAGSPGAGNCARRRREFSSPAVGAYLSSCACEDTMAWFRPRARWHLS